MSAQVVKRESSLSRAMFYGVSNNTSFASIGVLPEVRVVFLLLATKKKEKNIVAPNLTGSRISMSVPHQVLVPRMAATAAHPDTNVSIAEHR